MDNIDRVQLADLRVAEACLDAALVDGRTPNLIRRAQGELRLTEEAIRAGQ
ncbi:MAG: hypothetical protein M3O28_11705 [Actinomycetota bacterium]|nr:hypothetical protein [Actinomycetota bacterium]